MPLDVRYMGERQTRQATKKSPLPFPSLPPPSAPPPCAQNWLGHDVHEAHHEKPFYHVCVDPPDLVAGWTLAAACVFKLLLPLPLALTVLSAYMSMGLVYEWVHFIVHTRCAK